MRERERERERERGREGGNFRDSLMTKRSIASETRFLFYGEKIGIGAVVASMDKVTSKEANWGPVL